jgi:signal transduction histidine kinase
VNRKSRQRDYSLHSRITKAMLAVAIVSTVIYVVFVVTIVDRLEDAMMGTLVGHEVDEMVTLLAANPDEPMPRTVSVNGYMLNRDHDKPVPEYLRNLEPNIYRHLRVGDKTLMAAVIQLPNDRLYLEFDITSVGAYRTMFLTLLIGGGIIAAIVLIISGIWLSKKFIAPIGDLANDLTDISPDTRNVRISDKYKGYEVGVIAESIDEYLARLDEFVEREQSFTAAVSHELRTPVAVIASSTDLLELKGISPDQAGAIGRIKKSTNYMAKVIESLLLFIRNTRDAFEETMPEISLKPMFKDIMREYRQEATSKGIKLILKCKAEVRIRMSENHLEIIVGNLIRNALANTDQGEIQVSIGSNYFSVKDSGRGIEASKIENIVQLNYRDKNSLGHGVGLYLVTNICQYYGLKLNIKSKLGQGSEFLISFSDKVMPAKAA